MKNLLKYIMKSWITILFILLFLVIQAYCELSLPTYTAGLVDTGIGKRGISELIPLRIRESQLQKIVMFLSEEQEETIYSSYKKTEDDVNGDGIYELIALEKTKQEELESWMENPITLMGYMIKTENSTGDNPIFNEDATREDNKQKLHEFINQFGTMKESIIGQMRATYIEKEYQEVGININKYQMHYIYEIALMMLLLSLLDIVAAIFVGFLSAQIGAKTSMNLRNRLFKKVVRFSNGEMDKFSTASLITRSTNDVQQIQMVMGMMLRIVLYAPILGIGGIVKVSQTNGSLSWIIIVAIVITFCLVLFLFAVALPKFKIMQDLVDKVNLVAREMLTGIPVIRAFSTEKHEDKRFDSANVELAQTQLFTNRVMAFMMPIMMFLMNLVTVGIIWFGGKAIDRGNLQVGEMMAFLTYAMQIIMSFLMITMVSIILPRAGVAADRIAEVLKMEISIKSKNQTVPTGNNGEITFDHVFFKYSDAEGDTIKNISFSAKPGETTAFIGSTGSGKSTLMNLIPRFFDVTEGRILIDNIDIRNMKLEDLRGMLGYVPQKGVLFTGTIESNINFSSENINHEQVNKAAEISQSTDFINEKSDKYESVISQGGNNVSGGQKQRLSIARAIAKNPKIYIFDDSFSALDYQTDIKLRRALREVTRESTVLIVAQRISTIINADKIIVLEEGCMVGCGTHGELMDHCDVYQEIANSQLSQHEIRQSLVRKEGGDHE